MILVTGNRFQDFAVASGAVSAAEILKQMLHGEAKGDLLIGPGVGDDERAMIQLLGRASGMNVLHLPQDERRAGRAICHKHKIENQLISAPRQLGEDLFEADLLLDDRNEIMSDHITGCHLQGMLLVEATRQMFIAVGETRYTHLGVPERAYVVFNRLETRFEQFAFPLPTRIVQRVTEAVSERGRVRFEADVEIHQVQGRVAVSRVGYTIFDADRLAPKEVELARKATADQLAAIHGRVDATLQPKDKTLEAIW